MNRRIPLLALGLAACEPPPPSTIGPEGGAVSLVEGAVVSVPPGALEDDRALRIVPLPLPLDNPPEAPRPLQLADTAYAFEPEGLLFDKPVRVALPFSPARASGGARLYQLHLETGALTDLGGVVVRPGVVMAETRRLSVFVVGVGP